MNYTEAFKEVLAAEGGYVNDPLDSGGETYKGIARKHWPDWNGWPFLDEVRHASNFPACLETHLALQDCVKDFYRNQFWNKLQCDEMPHEIRLELFDTAVNQGKAYAGKFLQRSLNLLNRNGKDHSDLVVDGKIGPATVAAAKACRNKKALFVTMNVLQGQRYVKITEANPKNERFFNGWIARRVATA